VTDPTVGPPGGVRQLGRLLSQAARAESIPESRLRSWLSTRVLAAALDRARDEQGGPVFLVRGGVAMELRLDLRSRATQDYDAVIRAQSRDLEAVVRKALKEDWHGFTFTPTPPETIRGSNAQRLVVQIDYRGQPWGKVKFEVAPAEGGTASEHTPVAARHMDWARLPLPAEVDCVTLRYVAAQKLHASTEPPAHDGTVNDRFRDVLDLLLLEPELKSSERDELNAACREIFELRGTHQWPPVLEAHPAWQLGYETLCRDNDFEPSNLGEAAAQVNQLIGWIASGT